MEYQKTINLLDNTPDQPSKFRTKIRSEINDVSRRKYNIGSQIRFSTTMLKSNLCVYDKAYILAKTNFKQVIYKNDAPFIDCITEINNTQVDNANVLDVVMPMYNLIEYK